MKTILFLLAILSVPIILSAQDISEIQKFRELEWTSKSKLIEPIELYTDTTINIEFYHLEFSIDPKKTYLEAKATIKLHATKNEVSKITLNFHSQYQITSLSENIQSVTLHPNNNLELLLLNPISINEKIEIGIHYKGIPPLAEELKGMVFREQFGDPMVITLSTPFLAHYWFPCKDGPTDKADSVFIDITIPKEDNYIAVSNGLLENISEAATTKTFYWRERYPIVPYYVMVAIADYKTYSDVFEYEGYKTFPIEYYLFEENYEESLAGLEIVKPSIKFFSDIFGPYPFQDEKFAMTEMGFYGAIENQTNVIQNSLDKGWEIITVHEIAHMWFANDITCETWHHGWLNEGFATYCEALWIEHSEGKEAYDNYMRYLEFRREGTLYLEDVSDPFNIFQSIIYSKGAYVLHMLRGVVGDEHFFNILKSYTNNPKLKYGNASTEDFQSICETITGQDLDYFFEQWIFDAYYPIYILDYTINNVNVRINLKQNQSNYGARELFKMPVQFLFEFVDGTDTTINVMNDKKEQSFNFSFHQQCIDIKFDPNSLILKQIENITDVSQNNSISEFKLKQNYPNPFNSGTKIVYSIESYVNSAKLNVSLKVYDLLGREVATLVNEVQSAGNYFIQFEGNNLTSGIYIYKLNVGKFSETKKMLLLK